MNRSKPQEKLIRMAQARGLSALFVKRNLYRAIRASLWAIVQQDDVVSVLLDVLERFEREEAITFERWIASNQPGPSPSPSLDNTGRAQRVRPVRRDDTKT